MKLLEITVKRLSKEERKALQLKKDRNILHDHPMMKKGGSHEKSKKDRRRDDRRKSKIDIRKDY